MSHQPVGIGIIGTGTWGANHARVFSTLPQTRLLAVSDVDEGRAQTLAGQSEGVTAYTDHRRMLEDPSIGAITIATPDFAHTPLVLDAIAAGKHVLVEKPLATSLTEAEQIAKAVADSDHVFMVDFHNRVSPIFDAAHTDIAAGAIGHAMHGAARLSNSKFVPLQMLGWAAKSSALWFLGSHAVDMLRFLLGEEVRRVFAMSRKGVLQSRGIDTEDVHVSMLEFANGAVVTLENSWILSEDNPLLFDFTIELVGDGGQLQLDPSHNGAYRQMSGQGMKYRDLLGEAPAGHGRVGGFVAESIARFADAVVTGAPPLAAVEDGLAVTRILCAIEESARSGQPVDIKA